MKIADFGVEMWMNRHETACTYNLAETCVESLTVSALLDIAGRTDTILTDLLPTRLTYGAIEGSERLRSLIAGLYSCQSARNVVVAHGAIGANALVYQALVEPGDRVVSVLPTYQQHYAIPESLGAEVAVLRLDPRQDYQLDLTALRALVRPGTKLIALSNPNNPTGSLMDRACLESIVAIAREAGAWVLCDEVYRGTDQHGSGTTDSLADLYEQGISTGSMSKVFALAGLRLGWIVGPAPLLRLVSIHRDYNTISVGVLDDLFATIALENSSAILARSRAITRTNLAILADWVAGEASISWVRPRSGTTALLRYDLPVPSHALCLGLLEDTGVLFTPGGAMDTEGHLRIGYANADHVLRTGLERVSRFLAQQRARS